MAHPNKAVDINALRGLAIAQFRASDLDTAKQTCETILQANRRDGDTQNLLATIYIQLGDFHTARKLLIDVLKAYPNASIAMCNLGVVYEKLGQKLRAQKMFEQAIKAHSNFVLPHLNLARLMETAGKPMPALQYYHSALRLDPENFEALSAAGRLEFRRNNYAEALAHWQAASVLAPQSLETLLQCGEACLYLDRFDDTFGYIERILGVDSSYRPALLAKARLYLALDNPTAARAVIDLLLKDHSQSVEARILLADCYSKMGLPNEARDTWHDLRTHEPANVHYIVGDGRAKLDLGDIDAARIDFEEALARQPDQYATHFLLSKIKTFTADDPQIKHMLALLKTPTIASSDKADLHFSLGKAFRDIGDYETSFRHLEHANHAAKIELSPYVPEQQVVRFEITQKLHFKTAATPITQTPHKAASPKLIFIVGMPRSGTSLTEQILSSHSDVFGAGELKDLDRLCHPLLAQSETLSNPEIRDAITRIKTAYLESISQRCANAPVMTDKMPANFLYTGLVLHMFPDAKIVNLVRDPRAVCWSIFERNFGTMGHTYATDFENIAHYYRQYLNYMTFWREQFPSKIYDLRYEDLTQQQQQETAKLLEFCDLDWQDACLEFHLNQRAVRTASQAQVRQKMYTGSSKAWRKYQAHLEPLLAGLSKYDIPVPD